MANKLILDSGEYGKYLANALVQCSPNICRFLRGFNNGEALKYFDIPALKAAGMWYENGILRITDSAGAWRSAETQLAYFKKNRVVKKKKKSAAKVRYRTPSGDIVEKDVQRWYWEQQGQVKGAVVTNAFVGQSYHQYGLAVDLHLRAFDYDFSNAQKQKAKVTYYKGQAYTNFHDLIKAIGLVDWARACGLEWGGSWQMDDVEHFQDSSYKIPREFEYKQEHFGSGLWGVTKAIDGTEAYNSNYYWFDDCFNFDFVKKYNSGENPYVIDETEKKKTKRKLGWLLYLLAFVAGGVAVFKVVKR